jgi:chromosome segregation ATPase
MSNLFNEMMQEISEKDLTIADLEAKLAVADDCADRYWKQLGVLENENKELKAKLAECEKGNHEWVKICDGKLETINRLIEEKHELQQQLEDKEKHIIGQNALLNKSKENKNQTAIAELEKLKKDLEFAWSLGGWEGMSQGEVFGFINQQIDKLKGEK